MHSSRSSTQLTYCTPHHFIPTETATKQQKQNKTNKTIQETDKTTQETDKTLKIRHGN
jgi:hypothetical protein